MDCNGRTADAVSEIARVLRAGGWLISVSCRDPPDRLPALERYFCLKVCTSTTSADIWMRTFRLLPPLPPPPSRSARACVRRVPFKHVRHVCQMDRRRKTRGRGLSDGAGARGSQMGYGKGGARDARDGQGRRSFLQKVAVTLECSFPSW